MKPVKIILTDSQRFENVVESKFCANNVGLTEGVAKLELTRIRVPIGRDDYDVAYRLLIRSWNNCEWTDTQPDMTIKEFREADNEAAAIRAALATYDDLLSKIAFPHVEAASHPKYDPNHTPEERERYIPW